MAKNSGFGKAWRQAWNDGNDTFDWKGKKIAVVDKAGKRPPKRTEVNPSVPQATTAKPKEYEPSISSGSITIKNSNPKGTESSKVRDMTLKDKENILRYEPLPGPSYVKGKHIRYSDNSERKKK